MKRHFVIAILGLLLIGMGLLIGYLIPRKQPIPPDELMKLVPQMSLFMGADLETVETTFEDWLYPESKSEGKWKSFSGSHNGKPFEFQTNASMHTADDFETVIKHYSDKLRIILRVTEKDPSWSVTSEGAGSASENGVLVTYRTNRLSRDRSVQVGIIGMQAENCHVHLCVTRGKTQESTCVTVLFSKWHVD